MDNSSPLTATSNPLAALPPQQQSGAAGPTGTQDFRALLATQGVKAPQGAVPTAAEAQIEAAQIAGKANVAMGVKREPVISGMQQPQPANVVAPGAPRFLPLRQGPSAARMYSGVTQTPATTSIDTLRATTKFGPGPASTMKTTPVLARRNGVNTPPNADQNATETTSPQTTVQQQPTTTAAPKAVEAYTYGLRAASENKQGQVPTWFDSAVQNGLDKYDALNKAEKKP